MRIHRHVPLETECDARAVARYERKFAPEVEPGLSKRLVEPPHICRNKVSAANCMIGPQPWVLVTTDPMLRRSSALQLRPLSALPLKNCLQTPSTDISRSCRLTISRSSLPPITMRLKLRMPPDVGYWIRLGLSNKPQPGLLTWLSLPSKDASIHGVR